MTDAPEQRELVCPACAYDRSGQPQPPCPECGCAQPASHPNYTRLRWQSIALNGPLLLQAGIIAFAALWLHALDAGVLIIASAPFAITLLAIRALAADTEGRTIIAWQRHNHRLAIGAVIAVAAQLVFLAVWFG